MKILIPDKRTREHNDRWVFCLKLKHIVNACIKLRLNQWSHMDYFNDVITTFLDLECASCEDSQCEDRNLSDFIISLLVFWRWTKVLQVWNDMRVSKWWQFKFLGKLTPLNSLSKASREETDLHGMACWSKLVNWIILPRARRQGWALPAMSWICSSMLVPLWKKPSKLQWTITDMLNWKKTYKT